MSSNQNHPSTPAGARPAVEQQIYDPPAAYYSPMSFERHKASTPTVARPELERQNCIPPDTAYSPTTSPSQNQMGALSRAGPALEQQTHIPPNQVPDRERRDRSNFFATVMNPNPDAAGPAHDNSIRPSEQRTQAQMDALGQSTAALTSRRQAADAAPWTPPVAMAYPNQATAISAERENITWGSQIEQRIREEINPTSATMAMEAGRNRVAARSAEREKNARAFEAEQRAQAERDAIERNRIALAALAHARNTSRFPPTVTAGANSAVAVSAGREGIERASQTEQRVRAETNALLAEQRRVAHLASARENMERIPEAEQRSPAQWQSINRAASSNPPIPVADVNRAGVPSAALDGANGAARDSLFSSPIMIPSVRPPQPQTPPQSQIWNTFPGTPPMFATTAPRYLYTVNQTRPRHPRSRAELLQIHFRDAEFFELTP